MKLSNEEIASVINESVKQGRNISCDELLDEDMISYFCAMLEELNFDDFENKMEQTSVIDETIRPFLEASECDDSIVKLACQNFSDLVSSKMDNDNDHYDNGDMLKPLKVSVVLSKELENVFEETEKSIDENYAKLAPVELDRYSCNNREESVTEIFMNDSRTTNISIEKACFTNISNNSQTKPFPTDEFQKVLAEHLMKIEACSSLDESNIVSQNIVEESAAIMGSNTCLDNMRTNLAMVLQEYASFQCTHDAFNCINKLLFLCTDTENNLEDVGPSRHCKESNDHDEEEGTEMKRDHSGISEIAVDGIEDGWCEDECELCERKMKLTRHHLIPKSSWKRVRKKIFAAGSNTFSECSKLGISCILPDEINVKTINLHLNHRTCNVCRLCHSFIHKLHGEYDLAINYNTVDKLLADDDIVKHCMWASKQRVGGHQTLD